MNEPLRKEEKVSDKPEAVCPPAEFAARGWHFYGRQEYTKAIDDYHQSLSQKGNDPDTLYALGLALAASGQPQEAVTVFEQALASLANMEDKVRVRMLTRLIKGHISRVKTGDWHLTR